jgi:hypothetical protein
MNSLQSLDRDVELAKIQLANAERRREFANGALTNDEKRAVVDAQARVDSVFRGLDLGRIDRAVKWRRDLLRKSIDECHDRLQVAFADKSMEHVARDFGLKNQSRSRAVALARLRRRFDTVAEFQWSTTAKPSIACWQYLKIRSVQEWTQPDDHPRDRQDCICTNFLLAGRLPDGAGLMTGRWAMEYTWHAIARLLDPVRSPLEATALEVMSLAHKVLLAASSKAVLEQREDFLLEVADGCLRCQADPAELDGDHRLFVRANSWLTADQSDRCFAKRVPPTVDRDDALGAFWLAPSPLRRVRDGKIEVLRAAIEALA